MGRVYRAEVTRKAAGLEVGTAVALKVIHAHLLEQEGFFKRFLREAQIGQAVEHENVVRCFDCDATLHEGQQQNFLVMEYVEGQTLRDLLKELERVPEALCRHVGREIAKGLAAIHEAGVVHRDLKPENVLITEDHVVKVMDLGVARLQDEAIRLSQAGAFVGSLEYAAPEQFRSSDAEPDGRADLHALGVVLYELATGRHPYRDEEVSKVLHRILTETPRKAGEVNPQLSPFFEEVVHTLIAKSRDDRFASADDVAAILDAGEASDWWKQRAQALRVLTKRPLRRIRIPRETALYGRDDDLATLRALYEQAKAGDGQVLLVEGEAGIGKTRLVDEFVGRLRQEGEDVNFLFGSYPPGGAATASGAFSEAYREQFGAEGLEESLGAYLGAAPILVPAFAALLKGETTPKDAQRLTKESLQTVFVHTTRALAAERTTIVLIDDLHFAPEDGRALFASLALAVPGHRILLLGTMRPGLGEDWIANLERLDHARRTVLSRLGPKDLTRLLKDSFRSERMALELAGRIAVKCDGNPFFTFEIIRGLREGQFIAQQPDGTWVTTKVIEDIQVPSSVLDLVNARIADLAEEERDLLDVAACCGFEFEAGLVADVIGVARIPALKRFGQIERKHRLVRAAGRRCVFDHHQVQEALYGSLMPELRVEYHAAIGDALVARSGAGENGPVDLDGSLCVDICEHYLKGARGEAALPYLDAALDHLEAGYLNEQTVRLIDRVLDTRGLVEGSGRVELLVRKDARLDLLGRREAQGASLDEARALAEAEGDAQALAKVLTLTGTLRSHTGHLEEARECLEHGLDLARETGDRRTEAAATGDLGMLFWASGRLEEALEPLERGVRIAHEIGDRRMEANTSGNLGLVLSLLGRDVEAQERLEHQAAIAREIGDRHVEGMAAVNLGLLLNARGRSEDAKEQWDRFLTIAREVGDRRGEAIVLVNLGSLWLDLGQLAHAREAAEASLAICREIGARYPEGYALFDLARLAEAEGRTDDARHFARESLATRRAIGQGDGVSGSLLFLATLERRAGRLDEARGPLEEALALSREQGRAGEVAQALALLAIIPGGDAAAAETAFQEAGHPHAADAIRYHLWRATGKPEHLVEAKRLLDDRVGHAPAAYRASMLENVPLHREITEAWAEHGEKAGSMGAAD